MAAGRPFDGSPDGRPADRPTTGGRAALEEVLLGHLQHGQVYVAFSGGRDSSLVLAVATAVARREGFADPVPVVLDHGRHEGDAEDRDGLYRTRVLAHLRLAERVDVPAGVRQDVVGERARAVLLRHGVGYPAPSAAKAPFYAAARGGILLTGEGGDELFLHHRATVWAHLRTTRRPGGRAVWRTAARSLRPHPWRQAELERALDRAYTWLRPTARHEVVRRVSRGVALEPLHYARAARSRARRRSARLGYARMAALAAEQGAVLAHPLADPGVVEGVAAEGGALGWPSRTAATAALVGDLLPPDVVGRRDKAGFNGLAVGPDARTFAGTWDGSGVDLELVDPEALRQAWLAALPRPEVLLLLQQAWLAAARRAGRAAGPL